MNQTQTKPLGKNEWIDIGLKTLVREGIEAVRVERLAKKLNVTKGSFYWHFKNRNTLMHALLEAWAMRATSDIIEKVESGGGNAETKIRTLFDIVFSASGTLDIEIRAWAKKDKAARRVLEKVDMARLDYIEGLFNQLGLTSVEATARSRFAYHALIGLFTLGQGSEHIHLTPVQFEAIFKMLVMRK